MAAYSFRQYFILLFSLFILTCLGGIAGLSISSNLFFHKYGGDPEHDALAKDAEWRMLPKPPERIKRLVTARPYTIYVKTESGRILGCFKGSKYDVNCWFEAKLIPAQLNHSCGTSFPIERITSERIDLSYCADNLRERVHSEFSYILKSDGSVWQWAHDIADLADTPNFHHIFGQLEPLFLLSGYIGGAIISLFSGIVLFVIRRRIHLSCKR